MLLLLALVTFSRRAGLHAKEGHFLLPALERAMEPDPTGERAPFEIPAVKSMVNSDIFLNENKNQGVPTGAKRSPALV